MPYIVDASGVVESLHAGAKPGAKWAGSELGPIQGPNSGHDTAAPPARIAVFSRFPRARTAAEGPNCGTRVRTLLGCCSAALFRGFAAR